MAKIILVVQNLDEFDELLPINFTHQYYKSVPLNCSLYRIRQNSRGGKLSRFSRFLLNRESFPVEYFTRLGIHYYKKLLPRKFSRRIFIFALTVKVFPLDCFDVYGKCIN